MNVAEINPAVASDHLSLELYTRTLRKARELGYEFPVVSEMRDRGEFPQRFLLMRHDIDTSPRNALEMARIEHRLGVRTSYFVLMHSPFYNPAAPPHYDALRSILDLGGEIGLHYDTQFFEDRKIDPLAGTLEDAVMLEKALGTKIISVSQHRPASSVFLKELNRHFVDAYKKDLMEGVCYISDSGFKWRGQPLIDLLGREDRIHALIHPTSWTYGDLDMAGTYRQLEQQLIAELKNEIEELITSTNQYLLKREQLDAARKLQYRQ
jgi:hypothetical protein